MPEAGRGLHLRDNALRTNRTENQRATNDILIWDVLLTQGHGAVQP